jgi:hypothetical protein
VLVDGAEQDVVPNGPLLQPRLLPHVSHACSKDEKSDCHRFGIRKSYQRKAGRVVRKMRANNRSFNPPPPLAQSEKADVWDGR